MRVCWLTNNGKQQQTTVHFKGTEAVGADIHFTKDFTRPASNVIRNEEIVLVTQPLNPVNRLLTSAQQNQTDKPRSV